MTKSKVAAVDEAATLEDAEGVATDAIYYFARSIIHPDPDQPREVPDGELQASIDAQGVIQPITVRPHPEISDEWMIVDGARRYAGSTKLQEIPCRIRLDLEDVAERVILQLTANTGKPLTPLEEARALRKVLDSCEPKISTAELARRTGMARSTVQDRLGLLSVPEPWITMLAAGDLQPSHVPSILPFKDLPASAHQAAKKELAESWQWSQRGAAPIAVDRFNEIVRRAFEKQLFPLGRKDQITSVTLEPKDYDGLVISYQRRFSYPSDDKPRKYAADPAKWHPIVKKLEAKHKASAPSANGIKPSVAKGNVRIRLAKDVEIVKGKNDYGAAPKGLFVLTTPEGRWDAGLDSDIDFEYLAAELPQSAVVRYATPYNYGIDRTATRWDLVVTTARERWIARWEKRRTELFQSAAPAIASALTKFQVVGPGARSILLKLAAGGDALIIARAASMLDELVPSFDGPSWEAGAKIRKWLEELTSEEPYFSRLLSLVAAIAAKEITPVADQIRAEQHDERMRYQQLPVPWIEGSGGTASEDLDADDLDEEDLDDVGEARLAEEELEEVEEEELVEA